MNTRYREKSLAEQNSFEIAWDLLMSDHFVQLRQYIFGSPDELLRFRQIVVNIILATGMLIQYGIKSILLCGLQYDTKSKNHAHDCLSCFGYFIYRHL